MNPTNATLWGAQDKLAAVVRVLERIQSIPEVCAEYGITPEEFHAWRDHFFAGALQALDTQKSLNSHPVHSSERKEVMKNKVDQGRF